MSLGDLVEARVVQVGQDGIYVQLPGQAAHARLWGLEEVLVGDELVDLRVELLHQGVVGAVVAPGEEVYSREELLALRSSSASQLFSLRQCPEEELEEMLLRSLHEGLPPSWWRHRTQATKTKALGVALRNANMPAVYAMQPESAEFREALGCIDPDPSFLTDTLKELWETSAPGAEAVEWLLLRGAPASILLPQDPDALKIRVKGLRLLRDLGPSVAPAAAVEVAGCLRDPEVKGRRAAIETLVALGPSVSALAPRAAPRLAKLLQDPDALCAAEAAVALGRLGPLELLAPELLRCPALACMALAEAGPKAKAFAQPLRELAQQDVPGHVQASAIQALGNLGLADVSLVNELIEAAGHREAVVREAAIGALGKMADELTGEALALVRSTLALALDDAEVLVREAAALAWPST